jgi:hypothetical protein
MHSCWNEPLRVWVPAPSPPAPALLAAPRAITSPVACSLHAPRAGVSIVCDPPLHNIWRVPAPHFLIFDISLANPLMLDQYVKNATPKNPRGKQTNARAIKAVCVLRTKKNPKQEPRSLRPARMRSD